MQRVFKNKTGDMFAIEPGQESLIRADWTELSEAEVTAILNPPPPPPEPEVLDPAQFEFMLALTGFGEVWEGLEQAAKDAGDMVTFAALRAERRRRNFYLDVTLAVVGQFRRQAAQIAPRVDLSDEAITAAWEQAAEWKGLGNGQ